MSKSKVRFVNGSNDPHLMRDVSHIRFPWLKHTTKDFLIKTLFNKKWTSRSLSELQEYMTIELRDKLFSAMKKYGSIQDIQKLEEIVTKELHDKKEKRITQLEKNRKRKEKTLDIGKQYFTPGTKVWVFDEKVSHKYDRPIRSFDPLPVKVIEQSSDGKVITIEFMETRRWYEAAGHWVYRGQCMKFKFDPITCMWLREGLTPEVCRSFGSNGKSVYFELSYTRQYLLIEKGFHDLK